MDGAEIAKPFSYMDSASGFVYFNLVPENLARAEADSVRVLLSRRDADRQGFAKDFLGLAFDAILRHDAGKLHHEWHHCLQSVFYPYRYLQSWRELSIAFQFSTALRHAKEPILPLRPGAPQDWGQTILYSTLVHGVDVVDGRLRLVQRAPEDQRSTDLTLTHLLEEATSIYQFKAESGSEGSGAAYAEWIRRRPSYTSVFRMMSRLMGPDAAYVALPPLVQGAFSTTWPPPSSSAYWTTSTASFPRRSSRTGAATSSTRSS